MAHRLWDCHPAAASLLVAAHTWTLSTPLRFIMAASALAKIWLPRGEEGLERVHWGLIAVRIAMHRFPRTSVPGKVHWRDFGSRHFEVAQELLSFKVIARRRNPPIRLADKPLRPVPGLMTPVSDLKKETGQP